MDRQLFKVSLEKKKIKRAEKEGEKREEFLNRLPRLTIISEECKGFYEESERMSVRQGLQS